MLYNDICFYLFEYPCLQIIDNKQESSLSLLKEKMNQSLRFENRS